MEYVHVPHFFENSALKFTYVLALLAMVMENTPWNSLIRSLYVDQIPGEPWGTMTELRSAADCPKTT